MQQNIFKNKFIMQLPYIAREMFFGLHICYLRYGVEIILIKTVYRFQLLNVG